MLSHFSVQGENKMATPQDKALNFRTAKRHLYALVRKYNQAWHNHLGFELDINIDEQEEPNMIAYTLIMKDKSHNAWEVRRIVSSLMMDLQPDFILMVRFMDKKLTAVSEK